MDNHNNKSYTFPYWKRNYLGYTGQNDDAERCLHDLEETTGGPLPGEDQLQVTAIRAFLARQQDEVHKAIELSRQTFFAPAAPAFSALSGPCSATSAPSALFSTTIALYLYSCAIYSNEL